MIQDDDSEVLSKSVTGITLYREITKELPAYVRVVGKDLEVHGKTEYKQLRVVYYNGHPDFLRLNIPEDWHYDMKLSLEENVINTIAFIVDRIFERDRKIGREYPYEKYGLYEINLLKVR